MKVSIIIRAYNEESHIGKLISGIDMQEVEPDITCEVILVDSGSTDKTVEIAKSMGAKIVHIKKTDFSFGKALNLGCEHSTGDFLLFASAHVYPVYSNWIQKMIYPFLQNDRIGLVYGKQVGNDKTYFSEKQIFRKWFPSNSDYNQKTPFCNNANCAIRRKLWEQYPYDETLSGLEDMDWAKSIMAGGQIIAYEAEAEIVHVHDETPDKIRHRYMREAIAMKKINPEITFSRWNYYLLLSGHIISDSIQAIKEGIFFKEISDIMMFRKNQIKGTYQGYNLEESISKELKNRFYYPNTINKRNFSDNNNERNRITYID
ncbi:glycosyltransferase [Croceitalea sp. MTPC9]|uniref:glycosyltransferase family 2 protein n=1 Tax=unclassified Croceitalea TaxID=2632280 RepID=UPI002B3695CC|nr:glycosyltransferase [Croceitalea sp. MTPC6]GMN16591.1 glycosyltransferase [Croceitalea sp. MTPC9]